MYSRKALFPVVFLVACIFLGGCSTLNVNHLSPRPWQADTPTRVALKFWTMDYSCARDGNRFVITGTALPRTERFPAWSSWMSELVITAYISDPSGRVLLRQTFKHPPMSFPPAAGIPFTFTLTTTRPVDTPAITFGYRMILLAQRPSTEKRNPLKSQNAQVFFASQEALRQ
ncbi:hypothetical protein [Desulfoplanes formicivorans]|uniref:Lipoprotein n=1 Tax=Desulfoplanes formicivorans TaxID=1592317 RepID=A0A194AKD5_9BACT|nr:hypothetical protein [Desulfoplanes formicivorans]GAU09174.1 lipoprotein [Desulfoplanes formicivorans]